MSFRSNNTRFVPFTAIEWKKIQTFFRSNNVEKLSSACDILNMWKCRMGNSTPIFIDISQLVLSSIVLDLDSRNALHNYDNSNNLRAVHGFAIIRFVNYVNEICQPEGSKLLSITSAVGSIGIPSWIVRVRHEATHCQVPSLNLLQNALIFCREWLWKHQWMQEFDEAIKDLPREQYEVERAKRHMVICAQIKESLNNFRQWRKENPKNRELSVEMRDKAPFSPIMEHINAHPDEFLQVFVQTCLSRRVKKTLSPKDPLFAIVSEHEQHYYFPLMQIINDKSILPCLLLELTKNISNSTNKEEVRYLLSGWADILLAAFLQEGSPRFATVSDQSWKLILKHIVLAPNFFNKERVERIMSYMKNRLPSSVYLRIRKLLTIAEKLHNETEGGEDDDVMDTSIWPIKNVADLQHVDITFSNPRESASRKENWTLANMNRLGPLGLTSDQTVETLCLEC